MIAEGRQHFRKSYRQAGELGHTAFRSVHRSATGLSELFRPQSSGEKRGDNPANSRRRLRTWPKLTRKGNQSASVSIEEQGSRSSSPHNIIF
jgi:hypothetical protein